MIAFVFDKLEVGDVVDDPIFLGGKKFVYGDCAISVELIDIVDETDYLVIKEILYPNYLDM